MGSRPLRADAARSRAAIVEAFLRLARGGEDVPFYAIAREAGVGQGTLYRHFPSRAELAAAVFGQVLDDLEELSRTTPDDALLFGRLLDRALHDQIRMHGLSRVLVAEQRSELSDLAARTLAVFGPPLDAARRGGTVRPDLSVGDVTTMLSMVDGVLNGVGGTADRERAADRAIRRVLEGILPR